jgi:uncharacterized protein YbjT (DUF2867 family)
MPRSALVAGGTGLVGGYLVDLLISSPEYDVIKVLVREGSAFNKESTEVIHVNYDSLKEYENHLKAEAVFCCLGTTIRKAGSKENFRKVDFDYPFELAKICLQNGSRQYNLITAIGADPGSVFFYNRVKGDVETAIKGLNFESLNIFRPSLLLGDRKEKRFGEKVGFVLAKVLQPFMIGSVAKYSGIEAETVAKGMIQLSNSDHEGIQIVESNSIRELGEAYSES